MARSATGSTYESKGVWFSSIATPVRRHFRLSTCRTEAEAKERTGVLASIARRLRAAGKAELVESLCRAAADAEGRRLAGVETLVSGLIDGDEKEAPSRAQSGCDVTFREFAQRWTSNELASQHRGRIKAIDHTENIGRLERHVYPIEFGGRSVGDIPLDQFSLDVAEHVLAQRKLPAGSVRHVAQLMNRVLRLAVFPARLVARSPFPPGWLPAPSEQKQRSYLFPAEEAALLACTSVPLVRRLLIGFCSREGQRKENAATLEWSNLTLDLPGDGGYVVLDETKNGRGASWALDTSTAEALRRWRTIAPTSRYVFPAKALPRHRRARADLPLYVDHLAAELREGLHAAGVSRAKLFQRSAKRLALRAHDLRAAFVTVALATGKSEDWVTTRTGHRSSAMVARYRREASTVAELELGWFKPLHEAIPELAVIGVTIGGTTASRTRRTG